MQYFYLWLLFVISAPSLAAQNTLPENFALLPDDVQSLILEYAFFNEEVSQHWGDQASYASEKAYVKYLDDYLSRAKIDFDAGLLTVETLASSEPLKQLKAAIVTALLTPDDPNAVDIYSAQEIDIKGKPFLHGRVLDQSGKAIRYAWRAEKFAQYMIDQHLKVSDTLDGQRYGVKIKWVKNHKKVAASGVKAWVSQASDRFDLPESLILGIIETESGFNSFAVRLSLIVVKLRISANNTVNSLLSPSKV